MQLYGQGGQGGQAHVEVQANEVPQKVHLNSWIYGNRIVPARPHPTHPTPCLAQHQVRVQVQAVFTHSTIPHPQALSLDESKMNQVYVQVKWRCWPHSLPPQM